MRAPLWATDWNDIYILYNHHLCIYIYYIIIIIYMYIYYIIIMIYIYIYIYYNSSWYIYIYYIIIWFIYKYYIIIISIYYISSLYIYMYIIYHHHHIYIYDQTLRAFACPLAYTDQLLTPTMPHSANLTLKHSSVLVVHVKRGNTVLLPFTCISPGTC